MALTEAEKREMAQLEKDVGSQASMTMRTPTAPAGLTPEERQEMAQLESEVGKPQSMLEHIKEHPEERSMDYALGRTPESRPLLAKGVGHVMDWGGGLLRTGLAAPSGVVTKADAVNALKGQAPGSAEYLTRMGVEEGPSADVPLLGHVSTRGALGLGLDVATDPLTMLAKAGKLNPVGEAVESAGKKTYKSGFKKIDERLAEANKKPFSDVLLEHGAPTGTTKKVQGAAEDIGKGLLDERQKIYDTVNAAGGKVSPDFQHAKETVAKLRYLGLDEAADKAQAVLESYASKGELPIERASAMKSSVYDSLPDSAFDPNGKLKGPYAKVNRALGTDFKESIEKSAEGAGKGLGGKVSDINENLGSLLQSERPMAMQVRRGETPNVITAIDAILAHEPSILALKKGADIAKTTWARTKTGKGLMTAGKSGLAQGLTNRGLLNGARGGPGLVVTPDGLLKMSGEE